MMRLSKKYVTLRCLVAPTFWQGTVNIQALDVSKTLQKGEDAPFVQDLRSKLATIEHPKLAELKKSLTETVDRVVHLISHVLSQEELIQTAVLTDMIYDAYCAIHLLEGVQYDL
ncbi:hypothetical protein [Polycladomyces subterraneus]|uniref:Uncharacterized protein n=1 Tax=Polycladomyces subterraneus TaxID=1016997 RepID=A0ABT8IKC4_9BACL|nr:hypothetical protein [Polycladomyces subterraneus]MDN4593209.1 hypothetical protein [Polycladomyces subterraneus]